MKTIISVLGNQKTHLSDKAKYESHYNKVTIKYINFKPLEN